MTRKVNATLKARYEGNRVSNSEPAQLPPTARARAHSQWARVQSTYQHAWRFTLAEPLEDDDLQSYLDACDGMPGDYAAMKVYVRDGELTILVRETESPDGPGSGGNGIGERP